VGLRGQAVEATARVRARLLEAWRRWPTDVRREVERAEVEGWTIDEPADYCPRCGASCGPGAVTATGCVWCHESGLPWSRLVRLGEYEPPLNEWIRSMKFARQWQWADWFGRRLAERLPPRIPKPECFCPVPMHWTRRWRRGFNQSERIARALAAERGQPLAPVLRRTRYTAAQSLMPVSQRPANVRASFAAAPVDLRGWRVWLVDDVITTGATARACARLLRKVGADEVALLVAAVADPKGRRFRSF